jgi:Pyridoxamine 5'-phosphate oxidase
VSIAVDLVAVGERLIEYGPQAYLLTVSDDHTPHAVSVLVRLDGDRLTTSIGRRTAANLGQRPDATLLWPPPDPGGEYSLIVDGTAVAPVEEGPVAVVPTRAVLHRVAGAEGDGPTCIPVAPA